VLLALQHNWSGEQQQTLGHSLCSGSYFCAMCHMIAPACARLSTVRTAQLSSLSTVRTAQPSSWMHKVHQHQRQACARGGGHATSRRRITALKYAQVALLVIDNGWDAAIGIDLQKPVLLRCHSPLVIRHCISQLHKEVIRQCGRPYTKSQHHGLPSAHSLRVKWTSHCMQRPAPRA